jgi:hypothetical protein
MTTATFKPTSDPIVRDSSERLAQSAQDFKESVKQVTEDVKETATAHANYAAAFAKDQFNDNYEKLRSFMKKSPIACIVAGFALGFFVGWSRR